MEWQPIETVKEEHGVEILVCEPNRTMAVVEWLDPKNFAWPDPWTKPGWFISDGHNDPIPYRNFVYVTHWMPLPPFPRT